MKEASHDASGVVPLTAVPLDASSGLMSAAGRASTVQAAVCSVLPRFRAVRLMSVG